MVKPEILAPCGTPEAFEAALVSGADAVYLAGDKYGARAYAGNFSKDVLLSTLERAHLFGVKIYLTVNTLLKNEEMEELADYLEAYYEAGLDAVLVQDFGVLSYLKRRFPKLPIHISTQMNVTSHEGALLMKELGAERVVLNREITLDEVKKIRNTVPVETEVFVHGAMCFSYSGRCLLSSYAGGRSGNRGRCAQPCRKQYNGKENAGYIMSMKDMCTLRFIPQFVDAGVDSLKIEGRMKNAAYVAAAVKAYKEIRDDYIAGKYDADKAAVYEEKLKEVFSRGEFTEGYIGLDSRRPEEISRASLIFPGRQGHSGVSIGNVTSIGKGSIIIKLIKELNVGDELMIEAGSDIKLTSNVSAKAGASIRLNAPMTRHIKEGMEVRRLRNSVITDALEELIAEKRTIPVEGIVELKTGIPVKITYIYKTDDGIRVEATAEGPEAEPASKAPVSDESLLKALSRLGETDFNLENSRIYNDDNSFVPVSVLNNLRREAVETLYGKIRELYRRQEVNDVSEHDNTEENRSEYYLSEYEKTETAAEKRECGTFISVTGIQQLETVLGAAEDIERIFIDTGFGMDKDEIEKCSAMARVKGAGAVLMLPHLYSLEEGFQYRQVIDAFDEIYIRNVDDLAAVVHMCGEAVHFTRLYLGASLYAYNDEAIRFLYELTKKCADEVIFEAPYELNKKEAAGLRYPVGAGVMRLCYGKTALMITAAYAMRRGENEVTDDKINSFFIIPNAILDYNTVLNGIPECLFAEKAEIGNSLLCFTDEKPDEIVRVLKEYKKGPEKPDFKFTRGHYYRGIE
ncbi:MAG: U32 family peptidase [Eubacterium sp.]|nr:U32 family peptidase [Eubacterium sp.]